MFIGNSGTNTWDPCSSNSVCKMGTLRKSHEQKEISISGESKDWGKFRTNVNNDLEKLVGNTHADGLDNVSRQTN